MLTSVTLCVCVYVCVCVCVCVFGGSVHPPLIHILEHTVRCVCGGEDALVSGDSGCCGEKEHEETVTRLEGNWELVPCW